MERRLILATRNDNKIREIKEILGDIGWEILSYYDFPDLPSFEEVGDTFEENAIGKAEAVSSYCGFLALGEDSGLEVDALDGRPGVLSARFAGDDADDHRRNSKLLSMLKGIPREKRTARFRCVVAIVDPSGLLKTTEGICEGLISEEPRGDEGFGYDPVFYIPHLKKTFAELSPETKNRISHRRRALGKARNILIELG